MSKISNSIINGDNGDMTSSFSVLPNGITITGVTKKYNTYNEMMSDKNPPDYAYVLDATGDPTVASGGAIYRYTKTGWKKMYEEESMDQDLLVEAVANRVNTYLVPTWIPVDRTEGLAQFDIDTTKGVYYSIRITDAEVEEYGKVFDINFLSNISGARYSNTIPLSEEKALVFIV
mgnify:CR=1 FL=1